ncbi:hypothetical protein D3C81_2181560 [compost metagenome]
MDEHILHQGLQQQPLHASLLQSCLQSDMHMKIASVAGLLNCNIVAYLGQLLLQGAGCGHRLQRIFQQVRQAGDQRSRFLVIVEQDDFPVDRI